MKFEVFLNKINQENIDVPEKMVNCAWEKSCCVLDCCVGDCCIGDFAAFEEGAPKPLKDYYTGDDLDSLKKMMGKKLVFREENDGGIVWYTDSDKVYKIDQEGLTFLNDVEDSKDTDQIIEKYGQKKEEVVKFLKGILE